LARACTSARCSSSSRTHASRLAELLGDAGGGFAYDTQWGSVVHRRARGAILTEMGTGFHRNHPQVYGYAVYAAAVVAAPDPLWAEQPAWLQTHSAAVDALVGDLASSAASPSDAGGTRHRTFDHYLGRSQTSGVLGGDKEAHSPGELLLAWHACARWRARRGAHRRRDTQSRDPARARSRRSEWASVSFPDRTATRVRGRH